MTRLAYSVAEVADALGMSQERVRRLIRRGALHAVQLLPNSPYVVPASALASMLGEVTGPVPARPSKAALESRARAAMARLGLPMPPA